MGVVAMENGGGHRTLHLVDTLGGLPALFSPLAPPSFHSDGGEAVLRWECGGRLNGGEVIARRRGER